MHILISRNYSEGISFENEKKTKLAFWQSLCVQVSASYSALIGPSPPPHRHLMFAQFGLARLPLDRVHRLNFDEDTLLAATAYETPDPGLPIVPSTLNRCQAMLRRRAHVNISQYWDARDERVRVIGSVRIRWGV